MLRAPVVRWLHRETSAGVLLLAAAAIALTWANSPWRDGYRALSSIRVGPESWQLDLTLAQWASDGLLAIFFFTVGLELKHEFVAGSLRRPREAAVPIVAAVGGMAVPAAIYLAIVSLRGDVVALRGWAIPTATDIAFALAVLAVFGRGLPLALRTFLLTLAVVDDLLAIIVIATFYTTSIQLVPLLGAAAAVAVFAIVVRRHGARWWMLAPVGIATWLFLHASGVHATVAGVLLGFAVPAVARFDESESRALATARVVRPPSSAVALPVFAFFAAGVSVDVADLAALVHEPVVVAIVVALVVGKLVGVLGTTAVLTNVTRLRLPDHVGVRDLLPVGVVTGIGFTVALLVVELSFPGDDRIIEAKTAVLAGSLVSAVLGAALLRWDARRVRSNDMNRDGVPDPPTARIGDDR